MMRHFHDIEFKQPDVLRHALECVLTCLCDPCLPVRVEAATSIRELALLKVKGRGQMRQRQKKKEEEKEQGRGCG